MCSALSVEVRDPAVALESPSPSRQPAASRLAASVIVGATVLVYLNAFGNAFLWDDRFLVVDNTAIKHWGNIARIFTHALFPEGIQSPYYRPLQTLTYLVDYQ